MSGRISIPTLVPSATGVCDQTTSRDITYHGTNVQAVSASTQIAPECSAFGLMILFRSAGTAIGITLADSVLWSFTLWTPFEITNGSVITDEPCIGPMLGPIIFPLNTCTVCRYRCWECRAFAEMLAAPSLSLSLDMRCW